MQQQNHTLRTHPVHHGSTNDADAPGASTAGLLGYKTWNVVCDNSKIKAVVPGFQATIPFRADGAHSGGLRGTGAEGAREGDGAIVPSA